MLESYTYAVNGQLTSRVDESGAYAWGYDVRDRVPSANGNTTTSGSIGYQYDWAKRLTNANNGAVVITYNAEGQRIKKVAGGVTNLYLVDTRNPSGYAQVLEELTVSGSTTNLAMVYTYGLDLISQRAPGMSTNYFGYDGHGSTRFLTGAGGVLVNVFVFDAYGTLIASNTAVQTAYLYCGEQFDPDLGFYYLRARYLNPAMGRFWSMDSFEGNTSDPLSLHKYLYCHADPVNGIDPSGHENIISVLTGFSIQLQLRTVQFIAAHPVYTALGGIAVSVAFPQLEGIPPGHPSPLDEMGQVGRIIRQGIAKGLAKVAMNNHHPLPKFLGGDKVQNYIRIPNNVHDAYHRILHERLKAKGFPHGGLGGSGNSAADWARLGAMAAEARCGTGVTGRGVPRSGTGGRADRPVLQPTPTVSHH